MGTLQIQLRPPFSPCSAEPQRSWTGHLSSSPTSLSKRTKQLLSQGRRTKPATAMSSPKPVPAHIRARYERLVGAEMAYASASTSEMTATAGRGGGDDGRGLVLDDRRFLLGRVIEIKMERTRDERWIFKCTNAQKLKKTYALQQQQSPENQAKMKASADVIRELGLEDVQIFFSEDMILLEGFYQYVTDRSAPSMPKRLMTFFKQFRRHLLGLEAFRLINKVLVAERTPPKEKFVKQEDKVSPAVPGKRATASFVALVAAAAAASPVSAAAAAAATAVKESEDGSVMKSRPQRLITHPAVDLMELFFPASTEPQVDRELIVCLNTAEPGMDLVTDRLLPNDGKSDPFNQHAYRKGVKEVETRYARWRDESADGAERRRTDPRQKAIAVALRQD